jgi:hypothetical protein
MIFSDIDMFFKKGTTLPAQKTTASDVLDNLYQRNLQDAQVLVIHSSTAPMTGTSAFTSIALQTADTNTEATTWETVRTWATPFANKDGYLVCDTMPAGLKRYARLSVVVASATAQTMTAGITLAKDMDFDMGMFDPAVKFDGVVGQPTV